MRTLERDLDELREELEALAAWKGVADDGTLDWCTRQAQGAFVAIQLAPDSQKGDEAGKWLVPLYEALWDRAKKAAAPPTASTPPTIKPDEMIVLKLPAAMGVLGWSTKPLVERLRAIWGWVAEIPASVGREHFLGALAEAKGYAVFDLKPRVDSELWLKESLHKRLWQLAINAGCSRTPIGKTLLEAEMRIRPSTPDSPAAAEFFRHYSVVWEPSKTKPARNDGFWKGLPLLERLGFMLQGFPRESAERATLDEAIERFSAAEHSAGHLVGAISLGRRLTEALQWCGGSDDFNPKGVAGNGWRTSILPLLAEAHAAFGAPDRLTPTIPEMKSSAAPPVHRGVQFCPCKWGADGSTYGLSPCFRHAEWRDVQVTEAVAAIAEEAALLDAAAPCVCGFDEDCQVTHPCSTHMLWRERALRPLERALRRVQRALEGAPPTGRVSAAKQTWRRRHTRG